MKEKLREPQAAKSGRRKAGVIVQQPRRRPDVIKNYESQPIGKAEVVPANEMNNGGVGRRAAKKLLKITKNTS